MSLDCLCQYTAWCVEPYHLLCFLRGRLQDVRVGNFRLAKPFKNACYPSLVLLGRPLLLAQCVGFFVVFLGFNQVPEKKEKSLEDVSGRKNRGRKKNANKGRLRPLKDGSER